VPSEVAIRKQQQQQIKKKKVIVKFQFFLLFVLQMPKWPITGTSQDKSGNGVHTMQTGKWSLRGAILCWCSDVIGV
jgi:ABC-type Co2+ transport system permease subunit